MSNHRATSPEMASPGGHHRCCFMVNPTCLVFKLAFWDISSESEELVIRRLAKTIQGRVRKALIDSDIFECTNAQYPTSRYGAIERFHKMGVPRKRLLLSKNIF